MIKHFYWISILFLLIITGCTNDEDIAAPPRPAISTPMASNPTASTISISFQITSPSGKLYEKGVCWSEINPVPSVEDEVKQIKEGEDAKEVLTILSGLKANTTYYLRAYGKNAGGITYSEVISFSTNSEETGVLGLTLVKIDDSGNVTFSSELIRRGPDAITELGFCVSTEIRPEVESETTIIIPATGIADSFESETATFLPETMYYVRAFAKTATSVFYGETEQFRIHYEISIPSYPDYYVDIAGWNQRSRWNLANVHDPTVEKCGDYYYMYATNASYGNAHNGHGHFHYRRSQNLVDWEYMGSSMNTTPAWVKDTLNNMRGRLGLTPIENPSYGYWAPVVRKAGNEYRMYYCIIIDNFIASGKQSIEANFDNSWTERAFIGLRVTNDLESNIWEDKGMVVSSSTEKGKNWSRGSFNGDWTNAYFKWNAIDPSFIVTPEGEHWLIYGSWHSGIVALQLNPQTGLPLNSLGEPWANGASDKHGSLIATRVASGGWSRWQGSEAPEIMYKDGFYYLFLAYDELSVEYNTRVARSESITGPYLTYSGSNIKNGGDCFPILTHPYKFKNSDGWVGFSHNCVFQDDKGNWYYSSQARLPSGVNNNQYSNALMMGHIRKIRWTSNNWPVVMPERYAGIDQYPVTSGELVGTWEHINLSYQRGVQKTSVTLTLSADGKASGALTGNWSYNPDSKILMIGNQELCIERELDWEASPRKATIVYAGLNTSGVSLWGKKVD